MGFPILVRWHLYIESGPRLPLYSDPVMCPCDTSQLEAVWCQPIGGRVSYPTDMHVFFAVLCLTHWPLGDLNVILKMEFSILFYWLVSSHDNALQWMPHDLTDDKSTWVQVMAWCCQATSHYLSQCWLSLLSPYGVARPQWVKPYRAETRMFQESIWSIPWLLMTWTPFQYR